MKSEEVVLVLPLLADFEIPAVDALDHLFERHQDQVEKRAAAQARFALVEACLNAIEYGKPITQLASSDAATEVRLSFNAGEVSMSVTNPGLPFQPGKVKSRSGRGRGHGLKIIRSMMDSVSYDQDRNGTRVVMKKRVFGHGQASPDR